ncbi:protein STRUBBELIG-RECEPTOR FAMILY 6 [Tripterygium wilfordii]|uniref:Protein STRUBBELIG-RECEPTOR FAMILY 6 n=1 Tax=Tripterygium wilfordii TaxID=458696 RepID=A0A7J7CHF3_TRIWF|nr:protein STRUBBELIG-RECEPTOR FAMILY 6 [Tripterygium wilfordii]
MENWRVVKLVFLVICILGWKLKSINGATDPNDVSALKGMYSGLNSPTELAQWTGDDPCGQSWKGITCSGSRVTEIKVAGLGLSGSIGFQLSSLTSATNLDVSNNNITGDIPYSLPPNLQQLNLANNKFTGGLPYSISQITSLKYLNVGHNQLQNQLSDMFSQLSSLSTLDVSSNAITGNLPESFSSLSSLTTMFLQNNHFTGPIDVLANLPLENLNVENNQFTGWIPEQLKSINLQKGGNTWSSGSAPPPPPGTPPANKGNRNHKSGSNNSPVDSAAGSQSKSSGIGGGGIAGIVISLIVVGAVVAFFLVKRRSRRTSSDIEKLDNQRFAPLTSNEVHELKSVETSSGIKTVTFDAPASINLRPPPTDRHKSFDEEDVSRKPVVVKKAVLAVKKIDSSAFRNDLSEDFIEIVSNISNLHHPNVTELVGYCSEHGQHLLVYEFHRNGSLHDSLHLSEENSKPLTWNTRVKIALGTARALEYLHELCSPSIIHKNIKSTNILLDTELNPHLSDSDLATVVPNADQAVDSGYSAPEVGMSGQYTLKSDVYSFGVVMLELLSGRQPFDSSRPRSEQSLVRWAIPQLHDIDALSKMVDPALKGLYPVKSLSRFADVIALCVQPEPEFRPPMSEVVQALVRLVQRTNMSKRTFGSDQGVSPRADNIPDTQDYMS